MTNFKACKILTTAQSHYRNYFVQAAKYFWHAEARNL